MTGLAFDGAPSLVPGSRLGPASTNHSSSGCRWPHGVDSIVPATHEKNIYTGTVPMIHRLLATIATISTSSKHTLEAFRASQIASRTPQFSLHKPQRVFAMSPFKVLAALALLASQAVAHPTGHSHQFAHGHLSVRATGSPAHAHAH